MDDPLVSANPDYFLYAICEEFGGCGRGVQLDRKALLERYGPDLRCSELRSRLVCSSCGHRGAGLRIGYGGPLPWP